jgi:cyclic beta-1,2-glucan synthetase
LLDERVPFLHGASVPADREDLYEVPTASEEEGTLFEHGARAIDHSLSTLPRGAHGLPLMGTGDWNDGMNRVGDQGRGESVWLAWFLCHVIDQYAPWAEQRAQEAARREPQAAVALQEQAQRWRDARVALAEAIDGQGWDGQWYRRAFFDDGTPLGSASGVECRIDLIAQAWAVLSAAGDPTRAAQAMASARELLWDPEHRIMKLLDPPLAQAVPEAGYIQAYPPGIRENGGQYSHAAVWALMACAAQGDAAWTWRLFEGLSPAHRSADPARGARYGLEPYVVAGDIYSQPPYAGRGGWSWYTGAASWLQRAALESICGVQLQGSVLTASPCLPAHWPQAEIVLRRAMPGGEGERTCRVLMLRSEARSRELSQTGARSSQVVSLSSGQTVDLDRLPEGALVVVLIDAGSPGPRAGRPISAADPGAPSAVSPQPSPG